MAVIGSSLIESFVADTDLSGNQFFAVVAASTANNVGIASGGSSRAPFGILMNSPSAGQAAEVLMLGKGKLACNGGTAINVGDWLTIDASAKGAVASASVCSATALQAVASGCAIINVWWQTHGYFIGDNTP